MTREENEGCRRRLEKVLTRKKGEKRREREEGVARLRTIIIAATLTTPLSSEKDWPQWSISSLSQVEILHFAAPDGLPLPMDISTILTSLVSTGVRQREQLLMFSTNFITFIKRKLNGTKVFFLQRNFSKQKSNGSFILNFTS
jgi:hypothetical protein